MHARGIEHHTNGVNNVLSYINLVLATGKIGALRAVAMERSPVKATARADVSMDRKLINFPVNVRSRILNIANTSARFGAAGRRVAASRRLSCRDVSEDARRRNSWTALDL